MAERQAIIIDSDGNPVGTFENPIYVVASGMVAVASLVDLTDVEITSPLDTHYVGYNQATGKFVNKPVVGSGAGDVSGPDGSAVGQLAVFADTSGKLLKSGVPVIDTDGNLDFLGNKVINLGYPENSGDAATKFYVDQYIQGLVWRDPVESIEVASPESPADRARYIVDEGAVGDFIGHSDDIAVWHDDTGEWVFYTPEDGWACYSKLHDEVYVYSESSGTWTNIGTGGIADAPLDGFPYLRQNAGWIKSASSGMAHVPPATTNCLLAWNDQYGTYVKNAGSGAFVENGLFVKHPHSVGYGLYKIKTYGNLFTTAYAGIVDLSAHVGCTNWKHTNTGFVCNMISSVNTEQFGAGFLVLGHSNRAAIAVKPTGGNAVLEAICISDSGKVTFPCGVSVPVGDHNHDSVYLKLAGGTLVGVVSMSGNRITNLGSPVDGGDAATKDYVSSVISGIVWQSSVLSIESDPPIVDGRYLVASADTTGVFVEHEDQIATLDSGVWSYQSPETNWGVGNDEDGFTYVWNESEWIKLPGMGNHSGLQNLSADDHSQYVHISLPRTISGLLSFTRAGSPFEVTSTTLVNNLNAQYLNGETGDDFADAVHIHGINSITEFLVASPVDGQGLIYDAGLEKFVNQEIISSFSIDPNHQFIDTVSRDEYFTIHSDELTDGVLIAVASGFQQYDLGVASWYDRTAVLRGPPGADGRDGIDGADGAKGDTGEQGEQGIQGIQGPAGSPGTSINMQGSVATATALPSFGNTENDGYYVEDEGDCYVWTGTEWVNVGPIVGPQGLQGVQGPQGIQGATGATGPAGATGPQGPKGDTGTPGPRGPPGAGAMSWQAPVEDVIADTPIYVFDIGDRFLVASEPTTGGDLEGHANEIAIWAETSEWMFEVPTPGWACYVLDIGKLWYYDGIIWKEIVGAGGIEEAPIDTQSYVRKDGTWAVASIEDPYELPTASVDTLGGVKIGSGITITDGVISASALENVASKTESDLTLYVYEDATGSGDGSSKANGFTSLQAAIDAIPDVAQNVTIIVCKGSTNYLGDTTTIQKASVKSLTIRGEFYWYANADANAVAGKIVDADIDTTGMAVGDRVVCMHYSGTVEASSIDDYFYATVTEIGEGYVQTSEGTKTPTTGWKYLINQTVFDGNNSTTNCISVSRVQISLFGISHINSSERFVSLENCASITIAYTIVLDTRGVIVSQIALHLYVVNSAIVNLRANAYCVGGSYGTSIYSQNAVYSGANIGNTIGVSTGANSISSDIRYCGFFTLVYASYSHYSTRSTLIFCYIDSTCTYGAYGYNITLVSCTNNAATPVVNLTSGGSIEEWDGQALPSIANATGGQVLALKSDKSALEFATVSGGGGITWTEVTGTTQTAAVDNGYICNNAALVTVTLPTTCALGKTIRVAGKGASGWKIAQNASQQIHFGDQSTTLGTGGSISSGYKYDAIELVCITADTTFLVISAVGTVDVV